MTEFDDGTQADGSIKPASNSVTDRMVEAAQAWMRKQAGYLTLTDEAVRGLIEAALREQPAPEPVAWMYEYDGMIHDNAHPPIFSTTKWESVTEPFSETALYAHPPQRKPLTEEEIVRLDEPVADVPWERVLKFVRRIERAHGIGGEE